MKSFTPKTVAARAGKSARAGFTLIELLVVMAIMSILMSLLLPAIQRSRESARETQCKNNLRQIGIAFHNFVDANGKLPYGGTMEFYSAFADALPYFEASQLHESYDFTQSYTLPENTEALNSTVGTFKCPSMWLPREVPDQVCNEIGAAGSYAVCEGTSSYSSEADGMFPLNWPLYGIANDPVRLEDVKDGLTHTIMVGELNYQMEDYLWTASSQSCPAKAGEIRWGGARWGVGYPGISMANTAGTFHENSYANYSSFKSDHPGGSFFLFGGGSVSFVGQAIEPEILDAMATVNGDEIFDDSFRSN